MSDECPPTGKEGAIAHKEQAMADFRRKRDDEVNEPDTSTE